MQDHLAKQRVLLLKADKLRTIDIAQVLKAAAAYIITNLRPKEEFLMDIEGIDAGLSRALRQLLESQALPVAVV